MKYLKRSIFSIIFTIISYLIYWSIFKSVYYSEVIIISFAIHPFNIVSDQPLLWSIIKNFSIIFYIFSNLILFFSISQKIFNKKLKNKKNCPTLKKENLSLLIGKDLKNNFIFIPEKSLYQNILITGTIGTGKTSSAMYPLQSN